MTANDQGLVCILEEDSATFIASNNLLDQALTQSQSNGSNHFRTQVKRPGSQIMTTDSFKCQFTPVSAAFNPSYNHFVAVWGRKDLQILTTCQKTGMVKQELTVNLMLAAFGEQLSIIGVRWVPGSKTIIAVGTQIFIRVYDLSKDNFTPIYNIQSTGSIADFALTNPV